MSDSGIVRKQKARRDVASLLGVSVKTLSFVLYGIAASEKYAEFQIPKKHGGMRTIKAPIPPLKKIQRLFSAKLYEQLKKIKEAEEREKDKKDRKGNSRKPVSFAFRRGLSIIDNAKRHKGRRWVFNLDLQDFFPSFNFGRVRGFFIKDKNFNCDEDVATILAQIACDGAALPQGSPCSPIISELIAHILDVHLLRLAKKYKLTYSRYADDITFSTNQKDFPSAIAIQNSQNQALWEVGSKLLKLIEMMGFKVNETKTHMSYRNSRQLVTGLVVNKKVNITDEYYRQARAMCHSLFQKGFYCYKNSSSGPSKIETLAPLMGRLSFIYHTKDKADLRSLNEKRDTQASIRKLYKLFLFYKYFIVLEKPLIITEGKTDPIYLKEAVKHLPQFQPCLGKYDSEGKKFSHSVTYFNYRGSVDEVLELHGGGTSNLIKLLCRYKENITKNGSNKFKVKPMKYPVIIVLDNDSGLKGVALTVKNITDETTQFDINSEDPFYHIMHNLYVVKTIGKNSCIEKCFPPAVLEIKLEGKSLCLDNKNAKKEKSEKSKSKAKTNLTETVQHSGFDNKKHYGKEVFAQKVIKPQADKIDFSGFGGLLTRIMEAINDYEGRKAKTKALNDND